jgi:gamma-F420-2:alpha-L-glutamate ligase
MDLWILQKRPSGLLEPYELTRLREEARALNIRVEAVAPEEIDLIVSRGGRRSIRRCGIEVDLPDALLPRTGSTTDYFSLAILRQMENLGVEVINSSQAIEAVKDKLYSHQILAQNNLPIPRTMLVRFPVDVELVAQQIGFPCVVKLLAGTCGEGVLLSRDAGSFRDLMEFIANMDRSQAVILQQYISSCPGQDLRVWVIGGRVLGAMLRSSTDSSSIHSCVAARSLPCLIRLVSKQQHMMSGDDADDASPSTSHSDDDRRVPRLVVRQCRHNA